MNLYYENEQTLLQEGDVIAVNSQCVLLLRDGKHLRRLDSKLPYFSITISDAIGEVELARLLAYSIGRNISIEKGLRYTLNDKELVFWNTYKVI